MKMSGNPYRIEYSADVVKDDLKRLSKPIAVRIRKAIEAKLMTDPYVFGKPLRHDLKGARRLRVGDYRIVYEIEEEWKTVFILTIRHRRDVYE
jgi:mRNA interferase RelE/StbE